MPTRLVVGCMTGTSLDGLDVSLVEISGHGLAMSARPVRHLSRPLGPAAAPLRTLAEQHPMTAGEIARLSLDFADLHALAILELLAGERADLVCVHGQTVYHKPPLSWQLLQPAPIARAVCCPVVYDLRAADLAAGGQGAPITPLADWILYRHLRSDADRIDIVNLGGFCNVTSLPAGDDTGAIRAGDVCACNQLLDAAARTLLRQPFDENGSAAAAGQVDDEALEDLLGVMRAQQKPGRSLGTGDELTDWLARHRHQIATNDLLHTACVAVAEIIGQYLASLPGVPGTIYLAGGGARNTTLVKALASAAPGPVRTLPGGDSREPDCFAVLGALCQDRVPITLPSVTGCAAPAPISGAWLLP
jgi:1,6-anhydro-N-acetylmuramate kinase